MDDFWERRDRARRSIALARAFLYVVTGAIFALVYLPIRLIGAWIFVDEALAPTSLEWILAMGIGALASWLYENTLRRRALRILLVGLGVRAIDERNPEHALLRAMVDHYVPKVGLPRLDVAIIPVPAINVVSLRTQDDRYYMMITDGALKRLQVRHLQALVVHAMTRLTMPESRSWSTLAILFGSLNQMQLGYRHHETLPKDVGLTRFRFIGGFTSMVGSVVRLLHDAEISYRADHAAVQLTQDPVGMAEALYIVRHQWRGAEVISTAFTTAAFEDLRPAAGVGAEIRNIVPFAALHPPTPERIARMQELASRVTSLHFDAILARPQRRRELEEVRVEGQAYLVFHEGEVEGPYGLQDLQMLPWFHHHSYVRQLGTTGATMAYMEPALERLLQKREDPCPRCALPLGSMEHGTHTLQRCPRCRGARVTKTGMAALGIDTDLRLSNQLMKAIHARLDKEVVAWNHERWPAEGRIFPSAQCGGCLQPLERAALASTTVHVVLSCPRCSHYWIDPEDLSTIVRGFPEMFPRQMIDAGAQFDNAWAIQQWPASAATYAPLRGSRAATLKTTRVSSGTTTEVATVTAAPTPAPQPEVPGDAATAAPSTEEYAATTVDEAAAPQPVVPVSQRVERTFEPDDSGMTAAERALRAARAAREAVQAHTHSAAARPSSPRMSTRGDAAGKEDKASEGDAGDQAADSAPRRGRLIRSAFVPEDAEEVRRRRMLRERREKIRTRTRPVVTVKDGEGDNAEGAKDAKDDR